MRFPVSSVGVWSLKSSTGRRNSGCQSSRRDAERGPESGTLFPDVANPRKPPQNKDFWKGRSDFVTTAVYHFAGRTRTQISGDFEVAGVDGPAVSPRHPPPVRPRARALPQKAETSHTVKRSGRLGLRIAESPASVAQRVDDQRESGRRLSSARIVEMVPGKRGAPIREHSDQPALRDVRLHVSLC